MLLHPPRGVLTVTVWLTADPHLGHGLVSGIRGYADPAEHDTALCDAWAATVRPRDQVWVLGDLAVSNPGYALGLVAALPGEKHLVAGNHDACHPMHRRAHRHLPRYLEVFASVSTYARRRVGREDVLLSHFPYRGDHTEAARYTQYRLPDEGRWLVHGHTHSTGRRSGREVHVGWDAWGRLVSWDEVVSLVAEESNVRSPLTNPGGAATVGLVGHDGY
jgi:calcineurin-like phosphoesterase family protein